MASVATLPRPVVRVALHGACGRMGRMVIAALAASKTARLVAAIDRAAAPEIGRDAGEVAGVGALGTLVSPVLTPATAVDVCVDFSAPAALPGLVAQLLPRKVPAVICTTGVGADGARLIDDLSRVAGVIHTANTSLGVNVLLQVVAEVARLLGDEFDAEIVETHHRFKKDAPSGTALRLRDAVAAALGRDPERATVHGRRGDAGPRPAGEIGVHAVRAGDVVGEHTVIFGGVGERLELTHQAHGRETFARGALRAAEWLAGKPPGAYTMRQVLGL